MSNEIDTDPPDWVHRSQLRRPQCNTEINEFIHSANICYEFIISWSRLKPQQIGFTHRRRPEEAGGGPEVAGGGPTFKGKPRRSKQMARATPPPPSLSPSLLFNPLTGAFSPPSNNTVTKKNHIEILKEVPARAKPDLTLEETTFVSSFFSGSELGGGGGFKGHCTHAGVKSMKIPLR